MERKLYFSIGIIWTAFVIYACMMDSSSVPKTSFINIPHKDKIAHFTFYCVFSIIWFFYLVKINVISTKRNLVIRIFTIAVLIGGIVEIMQYYLTNTRSAEWADFFANCLGSSVGLLICLTTTRNKKI